MIILEWTPTLVGDCIYNGADDNASGVSAVLQMVKAFLASGGKTGKNYNICFLGWRRIGRAGVNLFCAKLSVYPID